MKILIVQDRLRSGGTERQSVLLANAFAAAGHPTTLLTFRPGGVLAKTVAANVVRRVLQPFDTGLDWFAPRLYRGIAATSPDIILCMGRMANCYAGGLQERFPTTTVVATMRTGKKLPRLFRRSLSIVRHVVANSHDAKKNLQTRYPVVRERISVIHNSLVFPPAPAATASIREQERTKHTATGQTVVLLCVAMFRPEKNQRELIEIVAQLPATLDWQLWLAGDGPARAACETLAAKKNLGPRVKFLGWQQDPTALYAAADIAVHASWSEALSNFLVESQACGLPMIAYEAQGIAECCIPGETGYVIARDDRAAFCEKISELAQADESTRAARTEHARLYARETFDRDRQVTRYLELFASLRK
jgi:glycosyltransferase involved in cell wall biosynthesis